MASVAVCLSFAVCQSVLPTSPVSAAVCQSVCPAAVWLSVTITDVSQSSSSQASIECGDDATDVSL